MINLNNVVHKISGNMGAVRVQVKLTNAVDEELVSRGLLNPGLLRVHESQALIDSGATRTVIPNSIVQELGLRVWGQEIAQYADGRQEAVGLTGPVIIEVLERKTIESALVTGNEVLIGQTALETLDLLIDCKNQRLIPNPAHPDYPVFRV